MILYQSGDAGMTKGQLEAKISEILSKFEVEYMGRGPKTIRTYILSDMIIIRLIGFLKKVRTSLFEGGRDYLEKLLADVIDAAVISTHSDISTKTGEKVIVITVDRNLEELYTVK